MFTKKHSPISNRKRSETITRLYKEGRAMGFRSEKGREAIKLSPRNYWRGKKLPYSVWNKGKRGLQVSWNRGGRAPWATGDKNHLWKGGITPINQKIRSSAEYKEWRRQVFERDNYRCINGGEEHGNILQADHIKPFAYFPELRLAVSNGRTLCRECHRRTDTYLSGSTKLFGIIHEEERLKK